MIGLRLLLDAAPKGAKLQATSIVKKFTYLSKETQFKQQYSQIKWFKITAV